MPLARSWRSNNVIAVIFEAVPRAERRTDYIKLAADLRDQLERIDGFISIERFESLTERGKFLSLSFWRDEDAVRRWRTLDAHRDAQAFGRKVVFSDYRLRVATVVRDYDKNERAQAPADSRETRAPPCSPG